MTDNEQMRKIPAVNELLDTDAVTALIGEYGRDAAVHAVRLAVDNARSSVQSGADAPSRDTLASESAGLIRFICGNSLKPVVNATGIALHTNLGRAPLGPAVMEAVADICMGYSNLEFDLSSAKRGRRETHAREIVKFLTGADDALVVNNNAAGIHLTLHTLSQNREVIVSRGELIEIGGSFRIPEIIAASGARMVEVGTTNRTRAADYENAITEGTAILFKAHKSNYSVTGFTEEASVKELSALGKKHNILMMYDIGSGLLRKPASLPLDNEPDVQGAVSDGADIIAFSCDKLLGGPQAGIVAGRTDLVGQLSKAPLMRALRVGKLTYAALSAACRSYLKDDDLLKNNRLFALLERPASERERLAGELAAALTKAGVSAEIVAGKAQCGGGTLPDLQIDSVAVEIKGNSTGKKTFAEQTFEKLLQLDRPILGILREGRLLLDTFAMDDEDIAHIAESIAVLSHSDSIVD